MSHMARSEVKKYAYCIIYYDGDDQRERGECKAFVEMLKSKFIERACRDGKEYSVFSEWNDQFGGNKVTNITKFNNQSYFTIVLYSPKHKTDKLNKYFSDALFAKLVETGRFLPVSIYDGVFPEHLNVTITVRFARDFRRDVSSWKKLVENIYKKRKHFAEAGASSDSDSSSDDCGDLEEEPKSEFLSDKKVAELSGKIGHEKKQFGIFLGFMTAELEQIESDHVRDSRGQIHSMLVMWRQRSRHTQRGKCAELQRALKQVHRHDLADLVQHWLEDFTAQELRKQERMKKKETRRRDRMKNLSSSKAQKSDASDTEFQKAIQESAAQARYRSQQEVGYPQVDNNPHDNHPSEDYPDNGGYIPQPSSNNRARDIMADVTQRKQVRVERMPDVTSERPGLQSVTGVSHAAASARMSGTTSSSHNHQNKAVWPDGKEETDFSMMLTVNDYYPGASPQNQNPATSRTSQHHQPTPGSCTKHHVPQVEKRRDEFQQNAEVLADDVAEARASPFTSVSGVRPPVLSQIRDIEQVDGALDTGSRVSVRQQAEGSSATGLARNDCVDGSKAKLREKSIVTEASMESKCPVNVINFEGCHSQTEEECQNCEVRTQPSLQGENGCTPQVAVSQSSENFSSRDDFNQQGAQQSYLATEDAAVNAGKSQKQNEKEECRNCAIHTQPSLQGENGCTPQVVVGQSGENFSSRDDFNQQGAQQSSLVTEDSHSPSEIVSDAAVNAGKSQKQKEKGSLLNLVFSWMPFSLDDVVYKDK